MKKRTADTACFEKYDCLHLSSQGSSTQTVTMIHEASVELRINGQWLIRTQCMAGEVEQMAVGFMVCEGLLQQHAEIKGVEADLAAGTVNVTADIPEERLQGVGANTRLASGGSKTGVIDLMQEKVKAGFRIASKKTIDAGCVVALGNAFNGFEGLYRESKFVHSAALSDGEKILCHSEDVGRHNAVDKVLGYGFLHDIDFSQTLLLCSGRFSLEMVSKAARMCIPIYVSPAAPSVEAVQLAEHIGMTLCGRVRADGAFVYSNAWRITNP